MKYAIAVLTIMALALCAFAAPIGLFGQTGPGYLVPSATVETGVTLQGSYGSSTVGGGLAIGYQGVELDLLYNGVGDGPFEVSNGTVGAKYAVPATFNLPLDIAVGGINLDKDWRSWYLAVGQEFNFTQASALLPDVTATWVTGGNMYAGNSFSVSGAWKGAGPGTLVVTWEQLDNLDTQTRICIGPTKGLSHAWTYAYTYGPAYVSYTDLRGLDDVVRAGINLTF